MNIAIIEKVLDVICEELSKKWYGYNANDIYRDCFLNNVLSYDYLISDKWLQYLYTYMNIETEMNINPISEFYSNSIEVVTKEIEKYDDDYIINEVIDLQNNRYGFVVSEVSYTIKKITCDYDYLCNITD